MVNTRIDNTKKQRNVEHKLLVVIDTRACITRPIRLQAFLKAWSFRANSKSVISSFLDFVLAFFIL